MKRVIIISGIMLSMFLLLSGCNIASDTPIALDGDTRATSTISLGLSIGLNCKPSPTIIIYYYCRGPVNTLQLYCGSTGYQPNSTLLATLDPAGRTYYYSGVQSCKPYYFWLKAQEKGTNKWYSSFEYRRVVINCTGGYTSSSSSGSASSSSSSGAGAPPCPNGVR